MLTFKFNTVEDYLASKSSNAADSIKTLLMSSANGLSRSAVSFITGTGQTFIDAVNVIVDEPYGEIGDTLLRKSVTVSGTATEKFFWLKSRAPWSQYSASFGSVTCSADADIAAQYTIVGVLIYRNGKDGLIMSDTNAAGTSYKTAIGSIPWCRTSDYAQETQSTWAIQFTNMPYIQHIRTRKSITRHQAYASLGLDMRERLGDGYNQYSNPFPRSAWNAMMAAYQAGSATAGNSDGGTTWDTSKSWTWKVEKVAAGGSLTGNTVKASFNFKTSSGVQPSNFNPADWDFKFDRWYKDCMEIDNTAPNSVAYEGNTTELSGREQTRRMIEFINTYSAKSINKTASTNCAVACDEYSRISTSHAIFGQHKWWLPNMTELTYATKNDKLLYAKGVNLGGTYIWSSTQYSQYSAFTANPYSSYVISYNNYKYNEVTVRAVSDYHFS